jgi:hypothetical protein
MRKLVSALAIAAILIQGPSMATAEQTKRVPGPAWNNTQCAPLAPLPRLGAEQQPNQGQNYDEPGRPMPMGRVKASSVPPPPPPPPPRINARADVG